MESAERIQEDLMPQKGCDGRDELNLAEFPLCALAHRLRPEQKTLLFQDRVWDARRREMITRTLTVTGSDAYGLPTALDDEVLLGLIQLTRWHDFADRKVPFTRHQLLHVLGWRDDSKSYARLEASLNRWTGVTLYYQRAWWNKTKQCWMDETFHVLDNVWLCHRDRPAPDIGLTVGGAPASAFVWNEVLFRSFQAGNLKSIDFDYFKGLRSAVAKRLYRFLDKRFYHQGRQEFDLKEFAWEHIGLARGYDTASLKRKLRLGVVELEGKGFLRPMPDGERFRKLCPGRWRVVFERARPTPAARMEAALLPEAQNLVTALAERGISNGIARKLVKQHTPAQIEMQIRVFDWMLARNDPKLTRNPPGFLVCAIRGGYVSPREFQVGAAQTREALEASKGRRETAKQRETVRLQNALQEQARERGIQNFWAMLPNDVRREAEEEAIRGAAPFIRSLIERGGPAAVAAKKCLLDDYARKRIEPRE